MRWAQIRHRAFQRNCRICLRSVGRSLPQRSTVLHWMIYGGSGGGGAPPGARGKMRVCSTRSSESQGGFGGVLGPLEKVMFSFWGGEFLNGLMKYLCFQFRVDLWSGRWSLDHVILHRLSKHIFLRNSEVNMVWKPLFFEHIQYCIFRLQWKHDAEHMILRGGMLGPGRPILMVIPIVFQ